MLSLLIEAYQRNYHSYDVTTRTVWGVAYNIKLCKSLICSFDQFNFYFNYIHNKIALSVSNNNIIIGINEIHNYKCLI